LFSSFKSSISKYRNIQRSLKYFIDIWKSFFQFDYLLFSG
jgi:hypothetical protein